MVNATTAPDDRQPVLHNENGEIIHPTQAELLQAWEELQAVPSYAERIQRDPRLFDERNN